MEIGTIAQLVERWTENPEVAGSIPAGALAVWDPIFIYYSRIPNCSSLLLNS